MPEHPRIPLTSDFERVGECSRFCGRCCSVAHWRTHPLFKERLEPVFRDLGENERGDCAKLKWENGRAVCSIYAERPAMCRDFPNHPFSIASIPECTFRFQLIKEENRS